MYKGLLCTKEMENLVTAATVKNMDSGKTVPGGLSLWKNWQWHVKAVL